MTTLYRYKENPVERIARKIKEKVMGDKLSDLFTEYCNEVEKEHPGSIDNTFSVFQGGFTKSAQSMRQRAMELVQKANVSGSSLSGRLNDLVNAIGSLSDIPE